MILGWTRQNVNLCLNMTTTSNYLNRISTWNDAFRLVDSHVSGSSTAFKLWILNSDPIIQQLMLNQSNAANELSQTALVTCLELNRIVYGKARYSVCFQLLTLKLLFGQIYNSRWTALSNRRVQKYGVEHIKEQVGLNHYLLGAKSRPKAYLMILTTWW